MQLVTYKIILTFKEFGVANKQSNLSSRKEVT